MNRSHYFYDADPIDNRGFVTAVIALLVAKLTCITTAGVEIDTEHA